MNRQEAIQEQIDDIMDMFDFRACCQMLEALIKAGRSYPEDWVDGEDVPEYILRQAARACMKEAVKEGYAGHSYFNAYFNEGEDDNGPWVKIDLYFGERTYNDGTSYEKTTTTAASN